MVRLASHFPNRKRGADIIDRDQIIFGVAVVAEELFGCGVIAEHDGGAKGCRSGDDGCCGKQSLFEVPVINPDFHDYQRRQKAEQSKECQQFQSQKVLNFIDVGLDDVQKHNLVNRRVISAHKIKNQRVQNTKEDCQRFGGVFVEQKRNSRAKQHKGTEKSASNKRNRRRNAPQFAGERQVIGGKQKQCEKQVETEAGDAKPRLG